MPIVRKWETWKSKQVFCYSEYHKTLDNIIIEK